MAKKVHNHFASLAEKIVANGGIRHEKGVCYYSSTTGRFYFTSVGEKEACVYGCGKKGLNGNLQDEDNRIDLVTLESIIDNDSAPDGD